MKSHLFTAVLLLLVTCVGEQQAYGDMVLSAVDSGYYEYVPATGKALHSSSYTSYAVGYQAGSDYRNFFVFDLSGVSGTVVGATLELFLRDTTYGLPKTYNLYDVSTDIGVLRAGGASSTALAGIWGDLGTGTLYGTATLSTPPVGGVLVSIELNADAIAALNSLAGSSTLWAIGGMLDYGTVQANAFFSTGTRDCTRQLALDIAPVPVPGAILLGLLGLGYSGLRLRHTV